MSYKLKTSLKAITIFIMLCAVAFIATWMGLSIAHKTNPIDEIKSWGSSTEEKVDENQKLVEDTKLQNIEDYSNIEIIV